MWTRGEDMCVSVRGKMVWGLDFLRGVLTCEGGVGDPNVVAYDPGEGQYGE